jgi:phage-related protein (TIGR01555 family)
MENKSVQENRPNSDIYNANVADGLVNVISSLGTAKARDPHSYLGQDATLDRAELEDIYRYYWISKAVDIKPWDMTREWRTFSSSTLEDDKIELLEEEERKTQIAKKFREALTWSSVYGGAGLVMHIRGHGDMQMPLDTTKIKRGQLERFSVVDRWNLIEFGPIDYNPISPTYGTAEFYYVANDTNRTLIHRSRIKFFRGRKMPVRIERQLKVWGDSDIQRWYKAITNSETLAASIIEGVHQSNIDVVSVNGLAEVLASEGGDQKAIDRFMAMDMCKSMLNMSVLDSEDSFDRKAFPFSGLPELYRVFLDVLSSATDIPTTRLLGSSPGGLNATGESDIRNYYDMIKSRQKNDLSPALYDVDQVLVRSALGDYPDGFSYEFNSLWQMTPAEEAQVRATNAQVISTLMNIGVSEFVLQKDAVELGLLKNLTIEDIEAAEKADDFDVDDDNDDFKPDDATEK